MDPDKTIDWVNWLGSWSSIIGILVTAITLFSVYNLRKYLLKNRREKRLALLAKRLDDMGNRAVGTPGYLARKEAFKDMVQLTFSWYEKIGVTSRGRTVKKIMAEIEKEEFNFRLVNELLLNIKTLEESIK